MNQNQHIKSLEANTAASEPYEGFSPKLAAYVYAMSYAALATPVMWLTHGFYRLGVDKAFSKVPFSKDTWQRFKKMDELTVLLTGSIIAWNANKERKEGFAQAKKAQQQFNKLSIEHDLYREQLTEAGIKPKDVRFIREVDARDLKIEEKPTASYTDKIATEKAVAAEACSSK